MLSDYDPIAVESRWYDWWESHGLFAPRLAADGNTAPQGTFVVPLPPPTINGGLHIGHALTVTIEDTLTRWYASFPLTSRSTTYDELTLF